MLGAYGAEQMAETDAREFIRAADSLWRDCVKSLSVVMKPWTRIALTLSIALLAACSACIKTNTSLQPPLPPAPNHIDQDVARQEAIALGVGPCADIRKIRMLPFRDELGQDRQFNRMVVNFSGYRECLIEMLADESPIADPGMGPKRSPYTIGNLAYDVISSSGFMDYETCVPPEIADRWAIIGAQALVEWTSIAGNRTRLQACVIQQLASP